MLLFAMTPFLLLLLLLHRLLLLWRVFLQLLPLSLCLLLLPLPLTSLQVTSHAIDAAAAASQRSIVAAIGHPPNVAAMQLALAAAAFV